MKVYLNRIDGIDDAIIAMHMSKRTWNATMDDEIRYMCSIVNPHNGIFVPKDEHGDNHLDKYFDAYQEYMTKLLKWGRLHITLLKFIDISVTVEGLHRAGQDDWDSHAQRFQNRIVRSSTRLASFSDGEKSDFYDGKIKYPFEAMKDMSTTIPDEYTDADGVIWVRTDFGYINKEHLGRKDVHRGLYPLAIPSNFIFRCNLTDWSHVYKERNAKSGANPEVKECCEAIADALIKAQPLFSRELFMEIKC
jgi:hypothetical protein|nr:MAG TPA: Thymidylate synthase thyX [Caudoviricetes sp.]